MHNNNTAPLAGSAEELLNRTPPPLALADYVRDGWRLFIANPVPHIAYTAVMLLILLVAGWVPIIGQLLVMALAALLLGALYRALGKQMAGGPVSASDYLEVLNDPLPLVLLSIVSSILIGIGFLLLLLPGIYLSVAYLFAVPLVVFYRLEFWTGLETSRKLITRQWFIYFILMVIITVLNMVGAAVFVIGLLVTLPLSAAIVLTAFAHQLGLPQPPLAIEQR